MTRGLGRGIAMLCLWLLASGTVLAKDNDQDNHQHDSSDHDRDSDHESDDGDSGGNSCQNPHVLRLNSSQILGGHKIYFDSGSLQRAFTDNTRIFSAKLYLTLERGHSGDVQNTTIAINGLAAHLISGQSPFNGRQNDDDERWSVTSSITDLRLDGARHATEFVQNLFLHKGTLVVWVQGPLKAATAYLELSLTEGDCSPTPPPPVAPKVQILTVSPTEILTSQSSETFTFQADQSGVNFTCSLDGATGVLCSPPWTVSGLLSGSHHFAVIATNAAGLSSAVPAVYDWNIDDTPVDVRIDSALPSQTTTNSPNLSLSFSSSKTNVTVQFQCSLDSGAYGACVSPAMFSGLTDGTHTIDVTGKDSLGNTSTVPTRYTWTVDQTPPIVSITQTNHANAITNFTDPSIYFSANESASFVCSLDGSALQSCQSPWISTGMTEGTHKLALQATDAAGNISVPLNYIWQIDLTPPQIILGNIVPALGLTNSNVISAEFRATEAATFTCAMDQNPAVNCNSPFTAPLSTEGMHQLTIIATDTAGNQSSPTTLMWTSDFTPPQIAFGSMIPSAASYIASSTLSAQLIGSESFTYQAILDGVILAQTSGSPLILSGLPDGPHSLIINAFDLAGNPATPLQHNFTVDTVAPVVQIVSAQYASPTNQSSNSITFSASKPVTYQCNFDLAGFAPCSTPFAISGLAGGGHTLTVQGIDLAGMVSAPVSYSWTIDLTPPQTTLTAVTNKAYAQFTFSSNKTVTFTCTLDGVATACAPPVTFNSLPDGAHVFVVNSQDLAGNIASPVSYSWTIDTIPPIVTLQSSPSATDPSAITFTFGSNKANTTFQCSLDSAVYTACASPMIFSGLTDGNHSFSVIGMDAAANQSVPANTSFVIQTALTTTITNITPSDSITKLTTISFSFSSNSPSANFVCSLDGSTFATCASPQNYSGLGSGSHTFTVRATNSSGQIDPAGASYSWTIDNTAPIITSVQTTAGRTSFTVTWTTSKPTTGNVKWGVGTLTNNVLVVDTTYSTTHTATVIGLNPLTVYSYILNGTDQAGNAYASPTRVIRTAF